MNVAADSVVTKVRVVIVDDSFVCRALLRDVLEADHDVTVVGEAASAEEALRLVHAAKPDLVTMDVRMPNVSGLEAVSRLMHEMPVPILVVTDLPTSGEGCVAFEATRRGALDVARKPALGDREAERALRESVRLLSRVKVVRHVAQPRTRDVALRVQPRVTSSIRIVGVGASAGGPMALSSLLATIPRDFPACFVVVQHLPLGFAPTFARYLEGRTSLPVSVVTSPVVATRGTILLADDASHLVAIGRDRFAPSDAPARLGHRPSVDVLFESLATHHGASALGVILSGIGRDGTAGLMRMRSKGAITIAEHESTATVYGMPRAARDVGAAEHVLPVHAMPEMLVSLTRGEKR